MRNSNKSGKKPIEEVGAMRPRKGKLERLRPKSTKHKKAKGAKAGVGTDKEETLRKTGIDILGDAGWGTHFCLFYHTRQDLIDILVPYFKAGLENNEFCMWVTSEPLNAEDAKRSLSRAVKNLDGYIKKGQIEILDYSDWYTKTGEFEADKVLQGWVEKHDQAINNGFDGLRLTGNTLWLEKKDWKKFSDYEAIVNSVIGKYKMLAICTYSLDRCGANEVIDVVNSHQFAVTKREARWEIVESTEHKRAQEELRESEERFRQFFENEPDYCYMISPEGIIRNVNNAALKALGYKKKQLIGQHLQKIYAPESLPKVKQLFTKWKKTRQLKDEEMVIITKEGDRRIVLLSAGVVKDKDGNILHSVSVQKDITERKKAEEEIREKNEMLEAFLYMISHDLKNPVVSIQGFCSLLLKNHRTDLNEKGLFYIERLRANADLMGSMVDDLLELSRIGGIRNEKRMASVQDVIKSVWGSIIDCFGVRDVEFVLPESLPHVFYSEKRLFQIFHNLLSNAVKFRSENKVLRVEVGYQDNNDNYTFFVQDNGISIEKEYHNKIFELFSQLKEAESEGTGVGLAIVKKIVEGNNGKVWVESQKGVGSKFYFTIPKEV